MSFSRIKTQVAKQKRDIIVNIADNIYMKRLRCVKSNCERSRDDNKRVNAMIIADKYAFPDVCEQDSFLLLTFAWKE